MNTEKAIKLLRRMQEPEAWDSQITRDAFDALEMAITALENAKNDNLTPESAQNVQKQALKMQKSDALGVKTGETCSDTISRQAAIDGVKTLHDVAWKNWHEPTLSANVVIDMLKELPSVQPDLQPTCNQLATDCINRQAAIDELDKGAWGVEWDKVLAKTMLENLPSAQPETCEGCKHLNKWENEVEYGYPSPRTRCKRMVGDRYER